jgi:hypothetical protein
MNARKVIGLILGCLGLAVIIIAGYYFHQLMFIMGLRSSTYINLYGLHVVNPLLIGVLLIANGIFVAGFNRKAAIPFTVLGDIAWIYFIININRLMTAETFIVEEYFIPSIIFFASLILLFTGALINSLE